MTAQQLSTAQIKLTYVGERLRQFQTQIILVGAAEPSPSVFQPYYRSGFTYTGDYDPIEAVGVTSSQQVKDIISSIATAPGITDGDVDAGGTLSFSIHNVVGGVTKVFEAILDGPSTRILFEKILAALGPAEPSRAAIEDFACAIGAMPGTTPSDVTSQVTITIGGARLDRKTGLFMSVARITNSSSQAIASPIILVLLPEGNVALANRDGETCKIEPRGMAILTILGIGVLPPGASVNPILQFENPDAEVIEFAKRGVFAGAGVR
jgi:hypothetical protein